MAMTMAMTTMTRIIKHDQDQEPDYYMKVFCSQCENDSKENFMEDPRTNEIICLQCFRVCTGDTKIINDLQGGENLFIINPDKIMEEKQIQSQTLTHKKPRGNPR